MANPHNHGILDSLCVSDPCKVHSTQEMTAQSAVTAAARGNSDLTVFNAIHFVSRWSNSWSSFTSLKPSLYLSAFACNLSFVGNITPSVNGIMAGTSIAAATYR